MEISLIISIVASVISIFNTLALCHLKKIKSPCLNIEFFKNKNEDSDRPSDRPTDSSDKNFIIKVPK
jgi:hypothetical protein